MKKRNLLSDTPIQKGAHQISAWEEPLSMICSDHCPDRSNSRVKVIRITIVGIINGDGELKWDTSMMKKM
jgi:hypothetical protein